MSLRHPQTATPLRGRLPAEGLGARGLERVARNPECTRLRALTLAGISPATAAREVYGETLREGRSPLALSAGQRFEHFVLGNRAAQLQKLYAEAGQLSAHVQVLDLSKHVPGSAPADLARRHTETLRILGLALLGHADAPRVMLKPRLVVRMLDTHHDVEPDALVWVEGDPFYRVVEVKAYPDRGGKTAPGDIRSACRQTAVGVVALRTALATLHAPRPEGLAPARGDLVFSVPGPPRARLRPMTLAAEVESIERVLRDAPTALDAVLAQLGSTATLDNPSVLDALPTRYRGECREHCALASRCKQEALACGDPIVLGDSARERLAPAPSLISALDLLRGRHAPGTPEESALQERLRSIESTWKKAANDVG